MPASGLANAQAVYQMTQQVSMMIGMAVLLAVANRSGNLADPISYRPSWATQSGVYVLVNLLVASLPKRELEDAARRGREDARRAKGGSQERATAAEEDEDRQARQGLLSGAEDDDD